jgi:hypothetical protein
LFSAHRLAGQKALNCKESINALQNVLKNVEQTLNILADTALQDQPITRRRKLGHLIIEHVHQRDVTINLIVKMLTQQKVSIGYHK